MAGGNERGRPIFAAVLTALGRLDADVLFTIGPFDPSWLGQVPANVSVAAYVPQAKAMICDIVVSHGGSGTTIAGLTRGLPMVAVPMFADQTHNADRLVAAGVGLRVDPDQVEEQLTSAIGQVLQRSDLPKQRPPSRDRHRHPPHTDPSAQPDSYNPGPINPANHHSPNNSTPGPVR